MSVHHAISFDRFHNSILYSDVEFVVKSRSGSNVKIPAHRFVLMSQSSVFESMLYGDLKEGASIKLVDTSAEVFVEFLQFFYMKEIKMTCNNIAGVLQLVDKYLVTELLPLCADFMEQTLTNALAYDYYELVLIYNLSGSIRGKLEDIICKNPDLILKKKTEVSRIVLSQVLKLDRFACKELDIFKAVMTWAKAVLQRKGRQVTVDKIVELLGEMVYDIRFPIMPIKDLMVCFQEYPELLPAEQHVDILNYVSTHDALIVAKQFNCQPRLCNEYVIRFAESNNTSSSISRSCFTMKWTLQTGMKYLISFRVHCHDGLSPASIYVTSKHAKEQAKKVEVPLLLCDMNTERVAKMPYSIEFNGPDDEWSFVIVWSRSIPPYHKSTELAPDTILPDGLVFSDGEYSIVSGICLNETF